MTDIFTQDVDDLDMTDTPVEDTPWGRLFPLSSHYNGLDLFDDEYTFGRGDECSVIFNSASLQKTQFFVAFSKVHFKLIHERSASDDFVFIQDLSSNGTFVNGVKIGRGKKQLLNNNDEISLAMKKNKCYVFSNLGENGEHWPASIRDKYSVSKTLGRGACGEVKLVFERGSCKRFAMKIIQKKTFSVSGKSALNSASKVQSEVDILKCLKHPCIIQIEDVIDTDETLYIVLELVQGGELFDRVVNLGQFKESEAKLLFYQMVLAIEYLHDNDITHRDLKPENILLASDENNTLVKVTDFGLSKFLDGNTMLRTFCGTPNYLAPEVLNTAGNGAYTRAIDVWSMGVILFICLVGYPPFTEERTDCDMSSQITGGLYDFPDEFWSGISQDAKDLVKRMLTVSPSERITLKEALNHPWFSDDDMRRTARQLMYPDAEDSEDISNGDGVMAPPTGKPIIRKRPADGAPIGANLPKRHS